MVVDVPFDYDLGIPKIPDEIRRRVRNGESIKVNIPLGSGFVNNALKHGAGGLNIDGCRISTGGEVLQGGAGGLLSHQRDGKDYPGKGTYKPASGRFPANLILSHVGPDENGNGGCVCVGEKKVKSDGHHSYKLPETGGLYKLGLKNLEDKGNPHADADGLETVENWSCVESCPVRMLDEQTGVLKSGDGCVRTKPGDGYHGNIGKAGDEQVSYGDAGGASRFFYCAKSSRSERSLGCEELYWRRDDSVSYGFVQVDKTEWERLGVLEAEKKAAGEQVSLRAQGNIHVTVKAIGLMRWLVRLVSSPVGTKIVDPFMGSGSTGVACVHEGLAFTGIDLYAENCEIAKRRIMAALAGKGRESNQRRNSAPTPPQNRRNVLTPVGDGVEEARGQKSQGDLFE